jgi:hypothetical protein
MHDHDAKPAAGLEDSRRLGHDSAEVVDVLQ